LLKVKERVEMKIKHITAINRRSERAIMAMSIDPHSYSTIALVM